MPWSVFLLAEAMPVPAQEVAQIVRDATGGILYDHVQRIHLHHGWVSQGLEEPQADRLVELLEAGGFPALKKSEDRLLRIERKFTIHRALLLDDALYLQVDLQGELQSVPWPSLAVVSAGRVKTFRQERVTETRRKLKLSTGAFLTMGLPIPYMKTETTTELKDVPDEAILVHLIFSTGGVVMEIRATQFDYGYLGARLAPTARENLLLLLEDLRRLAVDAHVPDMTRTFLETGRLGPEFKNDKDFLTFNRWIAEKTVSR